MSQTILQYLLGFCTWYGLSTIGEPPLEDHRTHFSGIQAGRQRHNESSKDPMPVWLILLFFALVAARYILSYLVSILVHAFIIVLDLNECQISYVFQIISTVAMVSSESTSLVAAAFAHKHPASKKPVSNGPSGVKKPPRREQTFRPEPFSRKKRTLTRAITMPIESLGRRFFGLSCLRGLSPYLIMSIAQWYCGAFGDLILSGQPKELESGYGSTSIILAVFFGGGYAVWTHYAITEPSKTKSIYNHFPRGGDILVELYPITCVWAVCEQMTKSLPLALSRSTMFELREYAWAPDLWNSLDTREQRVLLFKFSLVYLLYLVLVAFLLIPATMVMRRIHASMLPDADEAIVPFNRGKPKPRDDEESPTHSPGLSPSEAWSTLSWSAYFRVLRTFVQYFIVNQLLHLLCWEAEWILHEVFEADQYASPFPSGPTRLNLHFSG